MLTLLAPPGSLLTESPLVTKLGEPHWLEPGMAADFFFPERPTLDLSLDGIDAVLQPVAHREKKLLISDMDSTMIHQECIDELADLVGCKKEVAAITERAMNGEIDFTIALRERVALLEGLNVTDLERVYESRITFMEGARTLVATMKARGAYTLLVSGGFHFFTSRVAAALGFDGDEANRLEISGDRLTGRVIEPILDKDAKRKALHRICEARGIARADTLAVGDGANDLPMLQDAGLGIAYRAKPIVRQGAHASIMHNDLSALLYVQGIPKKEWVE